MIALNPSNLTAVATVNGQRFAGLNFRGFQEHRESFSVNIHFVIQASNNGVVSVF